MTTDEAILLIKAKMPDEESAAKTEKAKAALQFAVKSLNRCGYHEWNRKQIEISITSGTSEYKMRTIAPGVSLRRINDKMFYTDAPNFMKMHTYEKFSAVGQGRTTTGRPFIFMLYGNDPALQVYPIPDANYTLRGVVHFNITQAEQVPDHLEDAVIDRALVIVLDAEDSYYYPALNNWTAAKKDLVASSSYSVWQGETIKGDKFAIGHAASKADILGTDSGNLLGD